MYVVCNKTKLVGVLFKKEPNVLMRAAGESDGGAQPGGLGIPMAEQSLLPPQSGITSHAQPQR